MLHIQTQKASKVSTNLTAYWSIIIKIIKTCTTRTAISKKKNSIIAMSHPTVAKQDTTKQK